MSPDDMQRFQIYVTPAGSLHIGVMHDGCPDHWYAEVEDFTTLAELVQRADEHTEVCR